MGSVLCRKLHSIGWSVSHIAVSRNDVSFCEFYTRASISLSWSHFTMWTKAGNLWSAHRLFSTETSWRIHNFINVLFPDWFYCRWSWAKEVYKWYGKCLSYLFVCYVRMCIYHIYVCNVQISTNDMINVLTYCRFSYMEESVHCRQMSL